MLESFTNSYGETFKVGDKVQFVRYVEKNPFNDGWWAPDDMRYIFNEIREEVFTIDDIMFNTGAVSLVEEDIYYWPMDSFTKVNSIKAKPHVHAELIKMWADDPTIKFQYYNTGAEDWIDVNTGEPTWHTNTKYRVKPKVKIEKYYKYVYNSATKKTAINDAYYTEEQWGKHATATGIKEYVRLDWTMKEFEVEE